MLLKFLLSFQSVGICFIGKRNFHDFIEDYMEPKPGNIYDIETGENLGEHKGKTM